jgi:regulator of RNase E activity RraA
MNAVIGDIICTKAKYRGIAGFVVDGLVRDMPGIEHLDFPVFARGTTPAGPLHRGPGEINYAISCGGIVVNPGDVIVADISGIVLIPQECAEDILRPCARGSSRTRGLMNCYVNKSARFTKGMSTRIKPSGLQTMLCESVAMVHPKRFDTLGSVKGV